MPFEEFQDGRHCGNLECRNGTNLTVLNFSCLPPSFSSIQLTIREQMSFQDFGGHLGYWNQKI